MRYKLHFLLFSNYKVNIFQETFNAIKNIFYPGEPLQAHPMQFLENEMNSFPQMFLYSKEDDVIPHVVNYILFINKGNVNLNEPLY